MLKKYNKLWVFGDSYSAPNVCVRPQDSFWGLLATHADISTVINCSRISNSFDSVCQLLIGMQTQYDWQNDLFLIGIPPLERVTVFDDYKDTAYQGACIDTKTWTKESIQIPAHHGLIALQNYGKDRLMITHSDRAWLETQTLRTIFLLTTWLDSRQANYMILNLSKSFDRDNQWGPSEFLLPYAVEHSRCILFENTYHDVNLNKNPPADFDKYGWAGHHGPDGNRCFYENSLLPNMQRNQLC